VERALAAILSRPEFAERKPSALATRILDLLAGLRAWWGSLLARIPVPDGGDRLAYLLVTGCLVLLAAGVLLHLVRVALGLRGGRAAGAAAHGRAVRVPAPATQDWRAAAERAAQAGHWREAVLALYLSRLERLQQRGLVRLDDAKTPGDYRRELRADPPTASRFESFLRHFEPVAFGSRPIDMASFRRLSAAVEEIAGG
jgi:hypothetical protein